MWLENEYIKLRALEPEDLDLLYQWENQSEYWDSTSTIQPYSRFAIKEYISRIATNVYENGQLRLMIVDKLTDETIGTVDLFDLDMHNSRIAFGFFVAGKHQGKGFGKLTLSLIEEYVFNYLSINQIYAEVSVGNHVSAHIFRQASFQENRLLQWKKIKDEFEDVFLFQKMKSEHNQ